MTLEDNNLLNNQSLTTGKTIQGILRFSEFWNALQKELKQEKTFTTLKQKNHFKAYFDHHNNGELFVRITPGNGPSRGEIRRNEFEGVWNNAKGYSHETRFVNKDDRLRSYIRKDDQDGKTVHLSYIVALIAHIVNDDDIE